MIVTVSAGAWARRYIDAFIEIELPDEGTVADLLKQLTLPADEIGLIAVNGHASDRSQPLGDGDQVKLFPVIIGG